MGDARGVLQGTLDLLILRVLRIGPLHGWAISRRIRDTSNGVLDVNQGSLYPALHRLAQRGLLEAEWGVSPEGRRAKFYELTDAGRQAMAEEVAGWRSFAGAVEDVLLATETAR